MSTLSEALEAYSICARAEGKSPKTLRWVTQSVTYFSNFLGADRQISEITGDDLRRFIIYLQESTKYRSHPFCKPRQEKLSPDSISTYARGVRAFFGYLHREELIGENPMVKLRMPKVPKRVVPTLSQRELERLLAQPDRHTSRGFRDFALMITYSDTTARLMEIADLKDSDIDFNEGYLKVMGKGGRERYVPFGQTVAKVLLKYKLKHRPKPVGTDNFFLTVDGRPLKGGRIEKVVRDYGRKAGLRRCYPHMLRHTSSVLYLRNGGDPFTLQKKLGHSSLTMTRHYSNLVDSDVRAAQLKFGVADRLKT